MGTDNEKEVDGCNLGQGDVIPTQSHQYVVVKKLGEGGFGAVYKVHDQADPSKLYAVKVEKQLNKKKASKLKMEVAILKLVAQERSVETSHFTAIIDRGKNDNFRFIVMSLVGPSLDDLKKERSNKVFSLGTGLGAANQCLEAIEDLHKHGYIHRDIKPPNFAIGLANKRRTVYLLDFGISRCILNDAGELKAPRVRVGFKGTVRFVSLPCHRGQELGTRDDVESWFYLLLDLLIQQGLPWKKLADKNEVMLCKEEYRKPDKRNKLFQGVNCKERFGRMLEYIDILKYVDRVDYTFLYSILKLCAEECNVSMMDPYDWELEPKKSKIASFLNPAGGSRRNTRNTTDK